MEVDFKEEPDEVAFLKAVQEGNLDKVKFFVEHKGAYVDFQDYQRRTALHIACAKGSVSSNLFFILFF
jgi:ankyrin repeat protein